MAWTYTQKFNTLNDGDLHGQDSWSGPVAFDVQTTTKYEGAKAVIIGNIVAGSEITRAITQITEGSFYIAVQSNSSTRWFNVSVKDATGWYAYVMFNHPTAGEIGYNDGTWKSTGYAYNLNQWYVLNIEFETTGTYQQRFRIYDGTSWSVWYGWYNSDRQAGSGPTMIAIWSLEGNANTYWDTITPTNPVVIAYSASATEVLDASDLSAIAFGRSVTIAESLGLTEAVSRLSVWAKSITETLNLSDLASTARAYVETIAEALNLSEVVSRISIFSKTISETLNLTDVVSKISAFSKTISETLSLSDAVSAVRGFFTTISETINLSDTVTRISRFTKTISESLSLTDTITKIQNSFTTISETLNLSDTITKVQKFALTIAETLHLTDIISVGKTWWVGLMKHSASWTPQSKNSATWDKLPKH